MFPIFIWTQRDSVKRLKKKLEKFKFQEQQRIGVKIVLV